MMMTMMQWLVRNIMIMDRDWNADFNILILFKVNYNEYFVFVRSRFITCVMEHLCIHCLLNYDYFYYSNCNYVSYSYLSPMPWFILTECMRFVGSFTVCIIVRMLGISTNNCFLNYVTWLFLLDE